MSLYAVIMAGGGGTRLWPVSRQGRPKQSLKIMGHQTLFQATVARLVGLTPPDRILVATVQDQAEQLREQAPAIPVGNFLLEPQPKGTASVIGLAAVEIQARDPEAIMVCLPADHFIGDSARFRESLEEASSIAAQGYLVSLGIRPTSAETGYGYLEAGSNLEGFGAFPASTVSSFKEKPDADLAREYVSSGRYFWNAGIFVWRAAVIVQEIERWMPELHAVLAAIAVGREDPQFDLNAAWGTLASQTIDYGVMEHSERSAMVAVEGLGWWDVGSWDRLLSVLPGDEFRKRDPGAQS